MQNGPKVAGSRLTLSTAVLAGASEDKATDQLGQDTAQQRVQQEDSVTFSQALADATRHQGYHVAHLGHSQGQHTLRWGQREGRMGPSLARLRGWVLGSKAPVASREGQWVPQDSED